jgi:hypothetical protein
MPENYDIPPIISLHRYFCAVARMQKEYERVLQSPEHEEKRKTLKPDMFAIYLHSGPGSELLLRRFCRRRDRVGDRAPPNFVPSSTPSFTSCGPAASGDCCHANFHPVARSTITFKPGKTPVCGSIYIACSTSRPAVMPDGQLVHRW